MNIVMFSCNYYDYQAACISEGLQDLGHKVYDLSGKGLNYMEPMPKEGISSADLFIMTDPDNIHLANNNLFRDDKTKVPKVIVQPHDRWLHYNIAPEGPVKQSDYKSWVCDIAFVRDFDGNIPDSLSYPVFPMEFAIEHRYNEACRIKTNVASRDIDICFYGTLTTAKREDILHVLSNNDKIKTDFDNQHRFTDYDENWGKWVNGRFGHSPSYFKALCNSKMVLSPMGAGPSCGRTYEAYAAGAIPLIQRYPQYIQQIIPFVDGENCVLWNNKHDLIPKVEELLNDEVKLTKLADRCYKFGQENLLSKHRAEYIINKIKEFNII